MDPHTTSPLPPNTTARPVRRRLTETADAGRDGYDGTGIGVHTPVKHPAANQPLDPDNRTYSALLRGLRSLGERGFALLTQQWRTLGITASPRKIGNIIQVPLALTHLEHPTT